MAGLSELQVTRLRDWNILAGILSLGALFGLNYKLPDYGIETYRLDYSGFWSINSSLLFSESELQVTRLRDWNLLDHRVLEIEQVESLNYKLPDYGIETLPTIIMSFFF